MANTLTSPFMDNIMHYCKGNPGALNCMMNIMQAQPPQLGLKILMFLEKATTIRGTNLYVFYSDLCEQSLPAMEKVIDKVPQDVIEDASSRQDYSGKTLIAKYLD